MLRLETLKYCQTFRGVLPACIALVLWGTLDAVKLARARDGTDETFEQIQKILEAGESLRGREGDIAELLNRRGKEVRKLLLDHCCVTDSEVPFHGKRADRPIIFKFLARTELTVAEQLHVLPAAIQMAAEGPHSALGISELLRKALEKNSGLREELNLLLDASGGLKVRSSTALKLKPLIDLELAKMVANPKSGAELRSAFALLDKLGMRSAAIDRAMGQLMTATNRKDIQYVAFTDLVTHAKPPAPEVLIQLADAPHEVWRDFAVRGISNEKQIQYWLAAKTQHPNIQKVVARLVADIVSNNPGPLGPEVQSGLHYLAETEGGSKYISKLFNSERIISWSAHHAPELLVQGRVLQISDPFREPDAFSRAVLSRRDAESTVHLVLLEKRLAARPELAANAAPLLKSIAPALASNVRVDRRGLSDSGFESYVKMLTEHHLIDEDVEKSLARYMSQARLPIDTQSPGQPATFLKALTTLDRPLSETSRVAIGQIAKLSNPPWLNEDARTYLDDWITLLEKTTTGPHPIVCHECFEIALAGTETHLKADLAVLAAEENGLKQVEAAASAMSASEQRARRLFAVIARTPDLLETAPPGLQAMLDHPVIQSSMEKLRPDLHRRMVRIAESRKAAQTVALTTTQPAVHPEVPDPVPINTVAQIEEPSPTASADCTVPAETFAQRLRRLFSLQNLKRFRRP